VSEAIKLKSSGQSLVEVKLNKWCVLNGDLKRNSFCQSEFTIQNSSIKNTMHGTPHGVSTDQMLHRFRWSIFLTVIFVAGEATAGWWYNSLALISDAGHNLADGAALTISWYAMRMSQRSASHQKTFGYHRASILAALVMR
jgi:Co/Zn/Cd efflux system component